MILPKRLLMDIEGINHKEIRNHLIECENTKEICPGLILNENVGTKPFLVEIYVHPLKESKAYIAHMQFGRYRLLSIKDEPKLTFEQDHPTCLDWIGVAIYLPLSIKDMCNELSLNLKGGPIDISHGLNPNNISRNKDFLWFDLS